MVLLPDPFLSPWSSVLCNSSEMVFFVSSNVVAIVLRPYHLISFLYFVLSVLLLLSSSTAAAAAAATNATSRRAPVRHQLTLNFYSKTCPQAEQLVAGVTSKRFNTTPVSGPATIHLFFLDCFVEGCDASILIAPAGRTAAAGKVERDVEENRSLSPEGLETVKEAKAAVENKCPGVVSCADILAIAARDFVHLAGGPYYQVKTGRKDSKVSLAGKVKSNLPRSNSTINELINLFISKGLALTDLVALSGAHTIGFSHCVHFVDRLYDYRNSGKPDPAIDARLLKALHMYCPRTGGNDDVVAPFDVQTPFSFDHMYYGNLQAGMGLLASDQVLFLDPRTRPLVLEFGKDKDKFFQAFVQGMEKMGNIRIKKGRKGEIRLDCSKHLLAS